MESLPAPAHRHVLEDLASAEHSADGLHFTALGFMWEPSARKMCFLSTEAPIVDVKCLLKITDQNFLSPLIWPFRPSRQAKAPNPQRPQFDSLDKCVLSTLLRNSRHMCSHGRPSFQPIQLPAHTFFFVTDAMADRAGGRSASTTCTCSTVWQAAIHLSASSSQRSLLPIKRVMLHCSASSNSLLHMKRYFCDFYQRCCQASQLVSTWHPAKTCSESVPGLATIGHG